MRTNDVRKFRDAVAPAARGRPPHLSLGIIVADCFSMSSFAIFTDMMRLAAGEGEGHQPAVISWEVMSGRSGPTRASCGVEMGHTSGLVPQNRFDYIVVIGGLTQDGCQLDDATQAYLRESARVGVPLIGICTGSFILCRLGLMSDRSACVSWCHREDFVDEFPHQRVVTDRTFLVDKDRITASGGAGTADLALYLISKHVGKATARKAQAVLQFDRMRGFIGNFTH